MANLYVSCVKASGSVVGRLGTGSNIGVEFVHGPRGKKGKLVWHEDQVVLIPEREHAKHRRHYDEALRLGQLVKRTEEDHKAFVIAQETKGKADEKAQTERRAAAKKKDEELDRAASSFDQPKKKGK